MTKSDQNTTDTTPIDYVSEAFGIFKVDGLHTDKYWQLAANSMDDYEYARNYMLLFGLNVGMVKYQPLTGWYLFRVYLDGDEVDVKHDTKY